jgi:hypothetical protein
MRDFHELPQSHPEQPETSQWPEPEWTPKQALLALAGWQDARAGVPYDRWADPHWQQGWLLWAMKRGHLSH